MIKAANLGDPYSKQIFPKYSLYIPKILPKYSQQIFLMNNGEPVGATKRVSQPFNHLVDDFPKWMVLILAASRLRWLSGRSPRSSQLPSRGMWEGFLHKVNVRDVLLDVWFLDSPWLKLYGMELPIPGLKWISQYHFIYGPVCSTGQKPLNHWHQLEPSIPYKKLGFPLYTAVFFFKVIRHKIGISIIYMLHVCRCWCGLEDGYHNI